MFVGKIPSKGQAPEDLVRELNGSSRIVLFVDAKDTEAR